MVAPIVWVFAGAAAAWGVMKLIENALGRDLTGAEEIWLLGHSHRITRIQHAVNEAFARERRIFGSNGEDDEGDAFRHCYWAAMLRRDIGRKDAAGFLAIHEVKPGNDGHQFVMDTHNNRWGLWTKFDPDTNDQIAKDVLRMLVKGDLLVARSDPAKLVKATEAAK
ncbi:DUF6973 domain-containing protein [Plastoroseomonas hellenica]|uniref:DUF6973 domain-containing protein n=1 Tax=Plastoroseomonas hellenica TaxID=2687306 RepID=UPI001BA9565C|nr:hypothetical protein [Plastoroseomonas hellenica]MBR0647333.1 hypothetical protein [Plastoroseomonas hellenica]